MMKKMIHSVYPFKAPSLLSAFIIALAGINAAHIPVAFAQTENAPASFLRGAGEVRNIELGGGGLTTVTLSRDAKEVFVSDPDVVDAVARNMRTVFIVGKGTGKGTVVVSDKDGQDIITINLNVGRDLTALRESLKTAIPSGEIDFTVNDASIILSGFVDSANDAVTAQDIAKTFFSGTQWLKGRMQAAQVINSLKIRDKEQVMIKVTVAEIQRTVMKQFGVSGTGQWQIGKVNIQGSYDNALSINQLFFGDSKGNGLTLDAMEQQGVARLLAEPTLVAISGETAKFKAGGQIPVLGDRSCAPGGQCTYTYSYQDTGVELEFTPMVLTEGRISMKIKTEVREVDSSIISGAASGPAFKTREQETVIELPSGASMVTAGLIQQNYRQIIRGVPGLMKLPILGSFFRNRDYHREETELMIIVTPFIAKSMQPKKIVKPTDGFVDTSDPQAILLGRINKVYGVSNQKAVRSNRKIGYVVD